jgi:hypothetical protein
MNPDQMLKPHSGCLTVHQITSVVHTLTVPSVLLRAIGAGMLLHKRLVIRHEAMNLLLAMLRQFSSFITSIEQWNLIDNPAQNVLKQSIMKVGSETYLTSFIKIGVIYVLHWLTL